MRARIKKFVAVDAKSLDVVGRLRFTESQAKRDAERLSKKGRAAIVESVVL